MSKKSMCVVQILEKTAAVPIGRNVVSECDFLANSWRPRLTGTIAHLAAIFS